MSADQADVNAVRDQRFKRRIGRRLGEAIEPAVLQIRDGWRELEASRARSAKTCSESPPPSVWWRRTVTSLW